MTLLHSHSHHPLSRKEGIIYYQAFQCNMIISEDHIVQEDLNNILRILLARVYPLHLIIKNIKKALIRSANHHYPKEYHKDKPTFSPLESFFQTLANNSHQSYTEIGAMLLMTPLSPPFDQPNPYQPIPNPTVFIITLLSLHKHIALHSRTPSTTTHMHPYTPTQTYAQ